MPPRKKPINVSKEKKKTEKEKDKSLPSTNSEDNGKYPMTEQKSFIQLFSEISKRHEAHNTSSNGRQDSPSHEPIVEILFPSTFNHKEIGIDNGVDKNRKVRNS